MKPTQKIKRNLFWIGLALPMLALIAMTWLVHQAGGQFNSSFNWVLQNYKVLDKFEQTQAHIVDAEANQRGYLLTGHREYLEPYQAAMVAVNDDLADLRVLTANDQLQQDNLAMLERLVDMDLRFDPDTAFATNQYQTNASVVALTALGKQKMEDLRHVLFQAREEQSQDLTKHQQEAAAEVVSSQVMSLVLIAAVAVALVLVVLILLRLDRAGQVPGAVAPAGSIS